VLDEVDTAVESVLANITIKDVVSRLKPCVSTAVRKRKVLRKEHVLTARN